MKTLILSLLMLALASISYAQNVNIPDANFKNALISAGVDKDKDGEISYAEAEAITNIVVSNSNISNMTGIEAFINLNILNCGGNQLTSLNISNNTALTGLDCGYNQLTSLDVSSCKVLVELFCQWNQLTSLDISHNTALSYLDCTNNYLTYMDVSNNTKLEYLTYWGNSIANLDVSKNIALYHLDCGGTQSTSLDVSKNIALKELWCGQNYLSSLDLSNNRLLDLLICDDNQLASLDISNNIALEYIKLNSMPTLHEVCVWEIPFPPLSITVETYGSPNVYFTTDCSATVLAPDDINEETKIYPNPSNDILNIEIENSNSTRIELYDVSGTLMFSKAIHSSSEQIDVSGFSRGVYLVKLWQDNSVTVGKMAVR
jgi:hypothetical protein